MRYASFLLFMVLTVALAACGTTIKPSKTTTNIASASTATKAQSKTLGDLKGTVDGLSAANLPASKAKAQTLTADAIGQNKQIGNDLGIAASAAKTDSKTISSLSNPVQVRLNWIGIIILVSGIAATVASIAFATYIGTFAPFIRAGGIAAIVTGIFILALAYFLHTILVVLGIGSAVGITVYIYLHRSTLLSQAQALEATAKAAIQTVYPAVTTTPVAK